MKFRVEKVSEAMGGGFSFHSDLFFFFSFFLFMRGLQHWRNETLSIHEGKFSLRSH